jgi:hypothetical protein
MYFVSSDQDTFQNMILNYSFSQKKKLPYKQVDFFCSATIIHLRHKLSIYVVHEHVLNYYHTWAMHSRQHRSVNK